VDWKGLEEAFKQRRPRTAAQRLRSLVSARLTALVHLNPVRVDLVERFEKLGRGLQRRQHQHRDIFPGASALPALGKKSALISCS
jgi:hypothetical protein